MNYFCMNYLLDFLPTTLNCFISRVMKTYPIVVYCEGQQPLLGRGEGTRIFFVRNDVTKICVVIGPNKMLSKRFFAP